MKRLETIAFDISRCLVVDYQHLLGDSLSKRILGWTRSKTLSSLTTCSLLFPSALHPEKAFPVLRQIEALFKKNAKFVNLVDGDRSAYETFVRGETICRISNKRISHYSHHPERLGKVLASDIIRTKSVIQNTLGDFRPFLDEIPRLGRITAGATCTRSRRESLPYLKVGKRRVHSTVRAAPYLRGLSSYFGYGDMKFVYVQHNRVQVVPKNWKTGRTIACEPEGNLFLQLAADAYLKRRLRSRLGIDLSSQFRNQELARLGSIDGSLATIDLSMASDTLAYNAVVELLPWDWFNYLNNVRSPLGLYKANGEIVEYAKFSSMGNGCTFTIETLVFASMCKAVLTQPSDIFSVYGDDIIIPTYAVERLLALLSHFGFSVNTDKSYTSGPFRESCGADWFNGRYVTPMYLRQEDDTKPQLSLIVNGLAKWTYEGSQLATLLGELAVEHGLLLVPHNADLTSGVHITPHDAWKTKVLEKHFRRRINGRWSVSRHTPSYRCYAVTSKAKTVYDSRVLFLWHLDSFRQNKREDVYPLTWKRAISALVKGPSDSRRSLVPLLSHKYKEVIHCYHPIPRDSHDSMANVDHPNFTWWSQFICTIMSK